MADDDSSGGDYDNGDMSHGDDDGRVATVIRMSERFTADGDDNDDGAGDESAPEVGAMTLTTREDSTDDSPARSADAAVVLVDQRMRRRRIAVHREAGRRRLRRVLWVLVALVVVVDGAALLHVPMLDVDRISVEGAVQISPATVAWASRIRQGATLATLDEHAAERQVEQLSWVDDADVVREWPSTVRIVVTERQPAAVLDRGAQGLPAVVDASGRILDIGGLVPFGLIAVVGVEGSLSEGGEVPDDAIPALDLAVALNQRLPGAVAAVNVDLEASLSAGGRAVFGSAEELDDKMIALATLLSDVDMSCVSVVDLRVPTNAAVRRDDC